jgi:hypothetical protein
MPPATAPLPTASPEPQCLAHPDWLHHTLTVSGPGPSLTAFRDQAAGAGVVPWVYDYDHMEEDWVYLLLAPPAHRRAISAHGARLLARQLREAVWAQHEHALSQVGVSRACPFDLHRLVPVPFAILRLGADHPQALAWLWENWGTTWTLRHVRQLPGATDEFCVDFWSADWSPWPALRRIQGDWPSLRFHCRARY